MMILAQSVVCFVITHDLINRIFILFTALCLHLEVLELVCKISLDPYSGLIIS